MDQEFLYLKAVLDWYSRYVLSWELSNTLDVGFCLQAFASTLRQAPAPYIFNSDQGSQFLCLAFKQALLDAGCRISRDGRGRATDNAFIERLWRTVKWEHIYLNPANDGHQLHQQLQAYFAYYNLRRPHQSLGGQMRWSSRNGQREVLPSATHDRQKTSRRPAADPQEIHARF